MSSSEGKQCVNCMKVFEKKDRVKSLSASPADRTEDYFEIIKLVFSNLNWGRRFEGLAPAKGKRLEDRFVCSACGIALLHVYKGLKELMNLHVRNSLVGEAFKSTTGRNIEVQTENVLILKSIPEKPPQTPIKARLIKAMGSQKTRLSVTNHLKWVVHREMKQFCTYSSLKDFERGECYVPSDEDIEAEMMDFCPTVLEIFRGLFCQKPKSASFNSAMRVAISVAANTQTQSCNGFQKQLGVILYKHGAPVKIYDVMNSLHLSVAYKTTNNLLNALVTTHDRDIKDWKNGASTFLRVFDMHRKGYPLPPAPRENERVINVICDQELPEGLSLLNLDGLPSTFDGLQQNAGGGHFISQVRLFQPQHPQKKNFYYGIVFSFDNLNKMIIPKEYTKRTHSKIMNMTSAFAVYNRVPLEAEKVVSRPVRKNRTDLPLSTWLLTAQETASIKEDHLSRVKYHLTTLHPLFRSLEKKVPSFPDHKHSEEMAQPSRYVSLGVLDVDENTTEGMVAIIELLKSYCPEIGKEDKIPIVAFGDGLSTDRLRKSQESRVNAVSKDKRNLDIFPGNSSWHKQVLLLQDDVDVLMPDTTKCKSPGTMAFFRSKFGHTQASSKVESSFNHSFALMKFTMKAYIVAAAQMILGMEKVPLHESTAAYAAICQQSLTTELLMDLLDETSRKIVELEWKNISRSFHKEKVYCLCRRKWTDEDEDNDDYIGCDNMECKGHEWYHKKCLRKQKVRQRKFRLPPKGEKAYFCSKECEIRDNMKEYSITVLNAGLNHDCFQASIRHGDGDRMRIYHKLHMIRLHNHSHPLYFRIYHYILGLMEDGPPSVKHDLLYNSTLNFRGTKDGNVSLDFANEVLNCCMKESITHSKGNLSGPALGRRTQCLQFTDELRKMLEMKLGVVSHSSRAKKYNKNHEDIADAVKIILKAKLLKDCGDRSHEGYENFYYAKAYVDNICALEKRVKKLSVRVDQGYKYGNEIRKKPTTPELEEEEFVVSRPRRQ